MDKRIRQNTAVAMNEAGVYLLPLVLIVSLFFLWGMATNLNDILITHFKKAFALNDLQSGFVQAAFYSGYFCFSIPAAMLMQRLGYKGAVICGLLLYGAGALLFYPAAEAQQYGFFLFALFIIASGLAFLETSANPLIVVMGKPHTAARRLNLAQSFNPLGAITGVLIGREFIFSGVEHSSAEQASMSAAELILYRQAEIEAVQAPYLAIALVVLLCAGIVLFTRFPTIATTTKDTASSNLSLRQFKALFAHKIFVAGVVTQFFYVGAQVGVWSFMIRYGQTAQPNSGEKTLAVYLVWSLFAFMVGRFIATASMRLIPPAKLMWIFAIINIGLTLVAILSPNAWGFYALVSTSFFMSLMFPTIFALSLSGLGSLTKLASSFLVMAIIGGAVLTALMGFISDLSSINTAMLVPLMSYVVVAWFARQNLKQDKGGEV